MKIPFLILCMAVGATRLFSEVLGSPPQSPDASAHYLIYLHGGIVTASDGRPVSERLGPYEYRSILKRFEGDGFVVLSEIRASDADLQANAERVARWITHLKQGGVPSRNIAVVGASIGGAITARVSALLDDPELTYVFLAGLFHWKSEENVALSGRVLSIHDAAERERIAWKSYFDRSPSVAVARSLEVETGLAHGLIYTPHDAWYRPALEWIRGNGEEPKPHPAETMQGASAGG